MSRVEPPDLGLHPTRELGLHVEIIVCWVAVVRERDEQRIHKHRVLAQRHAEHVDIIVPPEIVIEKPVTSTVSKATPSL